MKTRHFCMGILSLAAVFSPARAELFPNLWSFLSQPSSMHGVAVPRPVPGAEISPASIPETSPSEAGETTVEPLIEDARPRSGSSSDTNIVPGWDGKRLNILGIDRTDFPRVLVLLQVRDANGLPSLQINYDGFTVTEDEAPQPISSVLPAVPAQYPGDPLSLAILIDSSGSMQRYMGNVNAAATRFVKRLRDHDEAMVAGFCSQPVVLCPMTQSKKRMLKGINNLYPRGFTALYDSVYMGVENLRSCGGRKAIVLLTDGKDDDGTGTQLSHASLEKTISAAQRLHVPLYIIGVGSEIGRDVLERMANETGGEFLHSPSGEDIDALYTEIARELGLGDEGYVSLTYQATEDARDGSDRTVIIRYAGANAVATYPAPKKFPWIF